ncbi:lanthionine synthetase LanC family protein [uncultured Abiotrophia sp.]|uniref:lanthionine synthetase LanC family protein n=1 Tax=uncultured Abiotrophia sp. TaxID=316094 RepID=UPI00260401E8|nr:lanthionine synthetase LanC family protein [uncultured Abiotrophia sp.]
MSNMQNILVRYLIDFYSNEDSGLRDADILELAVLYANAATTIASEVQDSIRDYLLESKFPHQISEENAVGTFSGNGRYLVALYLLYGQECFEADIYWKLFEIVKKGVQQIIQRLETSSFYLDDLDLMSGVLGVLNFLLEFQGCDKTISLELDIVRLLVKICRDKNGIIENFLDKGMENISGIYEHQLINLGCAHGILGIYVVLSKYTRCRSELVDDVWNVLNVIERMCFYSERQEMILPMKFGEVHNELLNCSKDIDYSWCYGIAGYLGIALDNTLMPRSLLYGKRSLIISVVQNMMFKYPLNSNYISSSPYLCHGLASILYELYWCGLKEFDDTINYVFMYIKDSEVFNSKGYSFEAGVDSLILSTSLGTALALNSIESNSRFKGDFIFGKVDRVL